MRKTVTQGLTFSHVDVGQRTRSQGTHRQYLAPSPELNLTGVYIVEVAVPDLAGLTSQTSINFTVINRYPSEGRQRGRGFRRWAIDGWGKRRLVNLRNVSFDDEPVEYLWVINDDRSWRGIDLGRTLRKPGCTGGDRV